MKRSKTKSAFICENLWFHFHSNLEQFEKVCQFVRQRRGKFQIFFCFGMREIKFVRVQKKSVKPLNRLPYLNIGDRFVASRVVGFIADDRMIDVGAVNADLMRSARF